MASLTEDDIYRKSSQYRLWSFTRQSLASLRATTNDLAADGVRIAIQSLHSHRSENETQTAENAPEVDCLTVDEEQKLVGFYCVKAMQFADFCEFPTNVKATAVQFMRRFYLSNSPMTYHPKEIMPSAIFLATKTENHYTSLKSFVSKLPKTTAEDVIAPEFLLTQGLRFTFDVRHPQRGLEGGFMELTAMANGNSSGSTASETSAKEVQIAMRDIAPVTSKGPKSKSTTDVINRIRSAHGIAKDILKTAALLTDAYFLYTPSQIWLAALLLADSALAEFYLDSKLSAASTIKSKLMTTLKDCGEMLETAPSAEPKKEETAELKQIDKKLYKCRNPEKIDLVSINKAQKRDNEGKNGSELDEKVIKKRKLEREKSHKDAEVFGPAIPLKNGQ